MLLSEEDQGTSHDWDVLQHLLLHLGQGGDVGEVPLVLARHPLGSLQIRDLSSNQVGEDTDRDEGLIVLLEDGLVGVGHAVGHQHDGLVSFSPDLKCDNNQISGCPGQCDCLQGEPN